MEIHTKYSKMNHAFKACLLISREVVIDKIVEESAIDCVNKNNLKTMYSWFRYCASIWKDVQVVPDIEQQDDYEVTAVSVAELNAGQSLDVSRKSSVESGENVVLLQTRKRSAHAHQQHIYHDHRNRARTEQCESDREYQQRQRREVIERIRSFSSSSSRISRDTSRIPSVTSRRRNVMQ